MKKGIIIGICAVIFIVALTFTLNHASLNQMKCESSQGNIAISYDEDKITGYKSQGIDYNLDDQQEYAEQITLQRYLDSYQEWFEGETGGTCQR